MGEGTMRVVDPNVLGVFHLVGVCEQLTTCLVHPLGALVSWENKDALVSRVWAMWR